MHKMWIGERYCGPIKYIFINGHAKTKKEDIDINSLLGIFCKKCACPYSQSYKSKVCTSFEIYRI